LKWAGEITAQTTVPYSLTEDKKPSLPVDTSTAITEYDTDIEAEAPDEVPNISTKTGRTFPDLIIEFKNDPRAMATILICIPFIIFVTKISDISSLKIPFILGLILNAFWFGQPLLKKLANFFKLTR